VLYILYTVGASLRPSSWNNSIDALAPAADMDRKAGQTDVRADRRTDGRTLDRYIDTAPPETGSVDKMNI